VITYTVYDPDDGSGRTYWWYGQAMVYVHQDRQEIDAFEVCEPDATPSSDEALAAVEAFHASR
jgi:hypothetical protein